MSLESELKNEHVSHLDLSSFAAVESGTPIRAVLDTLRAEKQYVALVLAEGALVGIFTDRDVINKVLDESDGLDASVDTYMTRDPITVRPDTSADDALRLMEKYHIRNLPVVDSEGKVVGDMTHRAVIEYLAARYPVEVLNLPSEPDRFTKDVEGA